MAQETIVENFNSIDIYVSGEGKTTENNGVVYQLNDDDKTARLLYVKEIKKGLFESNDGVLTIPSTIKKGLFSSYTVVGCAEVFHKGTDVRKTGWKEDRRMKEGGYYTGYKTYEKNYPIEPFQFIKRVLKAVHFPETWRDKVIPSFSFMECLEKVNIPDSVTEIGEKAFYRCTGLTSVTIGNGVKSIGKEAFGGCSGLTSINIPDSVTEIGERAFNECSGLTSINIPDSVTEIGNYAFSACSGLTSVYYSGNITQWCGITFGNYGANPLYYAHNLYINNNLVTDLVIPNTVTEIKNIAFNGATCLTSVTIPNSVTSMGYEVFLDCSGLTGTLTIPDSVTSIGYRAFYYCRGLTSVTIGNSVTSIGQEAFYGCSGLTSITIPASVKDIKYDAFKYCTNLQHVKIESNDVHISSSAFESKVKIEYAGKPKSNQEKETKPEPKPVQTASAPKPEPKPAQTASEPKEEPKPTAKPTEKPAAKVSGNFKKSAVSGDYTIGITPDSKVVVSKGGTVCDNAKGTMREISEKVGFKFETSWTTQQLGSKLVDFLNSK